MEDLWGIYETFMEGFWLFSGAGVWGGGSGRILGGLINLS
jgi:hypothetical protein